MALVRLRTWAICLLLAWLPLSGLADVSLTLDAGGQRVYSHPRPVKRVAVGDPAVATVTVMSSRNLLITARQVGATDVSVWESAKDAQPAHVLHVVVGPVADVARQGLAATSSAPMQAAPAGNGLALTGWAQSLEKHALARQAVDGSNKAPLDASASEFDSQVQIDIKIVEVSRQNMMRAGFFFGRNHGNSTIAISTPGNLSGVENDGTGFTLKSASGFLPSLNAFNLLLGNAGSGLLGALSVLEANGFAYTLAEPSLTAISGQSATFLAGGEFPVPVRSGSGADSTVTIKYKEYGVRLMLSPTVLDANRIYLKVSPEVSELDFNNTVQSGGVAVPGLRVRRTDTSVSLGNGESFVISGLVSRNTVNNIDKFPWLGDLPIIGAFFRSTRFDREDKELLMVVTPHLVRPIARGTPLPELPGKDMREYKPSFSEMIFKPGNSPAYPATGMSR